MSRNIEIKARARDLKKQAQLAVKLADGNPEVIFQEDTFFNVPFGRLKLRVFEDGTGELIQYERPDSRYPSESKYLLYATNNPEPLKEALTNALGVRAIVRKLRRVYLRGQTRIHFDQVEGLGDYIELEVVLEEDQQSIQGVAIAEELMAKLEIGEDDLIDTAYVDLIFD